MLAKRTDIDRASFLMPLGPPGFGFGASIGIGHSSGPFGSAFLGLLIGFLGQVVRRLMASHSFVLRSMIIVRVPMGVGQVVLVSLLLVIIKAVSLRNVFKTENMLGPFGWQVFVWDEYAIGVRSPLVLSKVRDTFGVSLNVAFGLLLRN